MQCFCKDLGSDTSFWGSTKVSIGFLYCWTYIPAPLETTFQVQSFYQNNLHQKFHHMSLWQRNISQIQHWLLSEHLLWSLPLNARLSGNLLYNYLIKMHEKARIKKSRFNPVYRICKNWKLFPILNKQKLENCSKDQKKENTKLYTQNISFLLYRILFLSIISIFTRKKIRSVILLRTVNKEMFIYILDRKNVVLYSIQ